MDDSEEKSSVAVLSIPNTNKRENDEKKNYEENENGDGTKEKEKNVEGEKKRELKVNVLEDESGVVRFSDLQKMLEDMKRFK